MAVRSTQQIRYIAFDTTPTVRLTSIKAEVLMKEQAPVGSGGGAVVTVIASD